MGGAKTSVTSAPRLRLLVPSPALRGKTKYVHARLPGRELVHLVSPDGLTQDDRFGEFDGFVRGQARTLCGKAGTGWIVGHGGEPCPDCAAKRR